MIRMQSNFYLGTEDWTVEGIDSEIQLDNNNGKLIVSDTLDQVWYFVAPDKFLGDQSAAYGADPHAHARTHARMHARTHTAAGKLVFTLGHFFFNSDDKEPIKADADIILVSKCDWSLSIKVRSATCLNVAQRIATPHNALQHRTTP
jgi:hypothetical protein